MEWGGITEDALLAEILVRVPVRRAQSYARLSKQMRRVAQRVLEQQLCLNPEQASAFLDAMRGHNVFLTGGAGVGKSHTLRLIRGWLERVGREYALTASTGCAAAIIGATTFHSTLGIGLAVKGPAFYVHKILKEDKGRMLRLRKLETLIVDEIGMLDGQLFDKAGAVVSQVRTSHLERDGTLVHGGSPGPYGGAQLVVCGDFMQLPPVEVETKKWVFQSKAWAALGFRNHLLTTVHRQSGDDRFAEVLGRMRLGHSTHEDWRYLVDNDAHRGDGNPQSALRLFATNAPADQVNWETLLATVGQTSGPNWWEHGLFNQSHGSSYGSYWFNAPPHVFRALDEGNERLLEHCPAPKVLWMCQGARVMCLKNLHSRLVNGSLGTVTRIERKMYVRPSGQVDGIQVAIVVLFDGLLGAAPFEHIFHVDSHRMPDRATCEFSIRDNKDKKAKASRLQLPLRLAWACSIHKSQGMSLDRVVIDFSKCFSDGQAYTALSRVRSLAGAWLIGLEYRHMRMVSRCAKQWYDELPLQKWE